MKTSNLTPFNPGKLENHLGSWGALRFRHLPRLKERKREGERKRREGGREGGRKIESRNDLNKSALYKGKVARLGK